MFTAVVIFLSKYFSSANENKNNEKTEINIEGIKVNKVKNPTYFTPDVFAPIFISFLREFFTKSFKKWVLLKLILFCVFNKKFNSSRLLSNFFNIELNSALFVLTREISATNRSIT